MKAVVKTRREPGIEVLDQAVPEVGHRDILVRVLAGSLCGSDVHIYEWTPSYEWLPMPLILGHEFSGEVVEVGSQIETVAPGDRVTAMPSMPCGSCPVCRSGNGQGCETKRALGLTTHGAFSEFVRLTGGATIFRLPGELSHDAAALCEPLSVSLHAVDISNIKVGRSAAILGPGPIGLLALLILRAAGACPVMVAGTRGDQKRLDMAEQLGADVVVNVEEEDPVARAKAMAGGGIDSGLDLVFEATGDPKSVQQALDMVHREGKVILIGIHSGPAQFNPTPLVRGKKSILGAYGYEPETWQRALKLLASGKVPVEQIITHRVRLCEAEEGFDLAVKKEAVKIVFVP